jgi:hypothetical protein
MGDTKLVVVEVALFSMSIPVFADPDWYLFSGDKPEVIGEASILLAQTCFPKEGLDGGNGHETLDVMCKSSAYYALSFLRWRIPL